MKSGEYEGKSGETKVQSARQVVYRRVLVWLLKRQRGVHGVHEGDHSVQLGEKRREKV